MESPAARRQRMVDEQLRGRGLSDPRVLEAFARVPRECFVPPEERERAYQDRPLAIGLGQTISQPYVVAFMLEQLGLEGDERVLEIGTGSGYQTALLAELAAAVYSIEFHAPLAEGAGAVLDRLGYRHIHIRRGDGHAGWPEEAPFDAIVGSAAAAAIPPALKGQLAAGGTLILPVGRDEQYLHRVRRAGAGFVQDRLLPVRFVPMLSG